MLKKMHIAIVMGAAFFPALLAGKTAWAAGDLPDPAVLIPRVHVAQSAMTPPPGPGGAVPAGAASATMGTMPHFEPPPVPEFMLRKPAQPLTPQEMERQAEEAAARARRAREPAKGAAANPGMEK